MDLTVMESCRALLHKITPLLVLEWSGVAAGLLGAYLNARGKRISFLVWCYSAIALSITAYLVQRTGFLFLQMCYFFFNLYGFRSWKGNAPTGSVAATEIMECGQPLDEVVAQPQSAQAFVRHG